MKLSHLFLIFGFLLISTSSGYSQFFNKFNFEIGVNRSKFINTSQLFPNQTNDAIGSDKINEKSELPSYSNNYSASLGYQISKRHFIRLRHSSNDMGSYISGNFSTSAGFCGMGATIFNLKNAHNLIKNVSFGGMYEFQIPIKEGSVVIGCGIEKQWNNFDDTRVIFSGLQLENFAIHSSLGYLTQLYKIVHLHSKFFITKSYKIGDETFFGGYQGEYIPLQIGVEIGFRIQFKTT